MLALGVGLGLGAAFCQSLSYLATRHYVHPRGGGSRQLLVLSHVLMGVASALILPFVWPDRPIPWGAVLQPLVLTAGFYLLGQFGLMMALRHAEPSKISPMLAFKLIVLALLTVLWRHGSISALQWAAVALCLAGTIALNYSGGATHPAAAGALVFTCVAYALSDWNIGVLVTSLAGIEKWRAFTWSALACYVLCGLLGVWFLPWQGSRKLRDWIDASPFAAAWLVAMLLLFACFGIVDVVYGNMLQSTRGLMSVLIGSALAQYGLVHFEKNASPGVFVRRLAAAGVTGVALVLWAWGIKPPAASAAPPPPSTAETQRG